MILFYTSIPRSFRTTLIGHLYEISQVYPVVLLAEELDPDLQKLISDKDLFPKLEAVVPVHQHTGLKRNLLDKERYLARRAKELIEKYQPEIVVAANDLYPFEMHLIRAAKKSGATTLSIQAGMAADSATVKRWLSAEAAYSSPLKFLPFSSRLLLIRTKKIFQHFLVYYLLPLLSGNLPFTGKTSFILGTGTAGERADYQVILSKRDYEIHSKDGIQKEKLLILAHPFTRNKKIFNLLSPARRSGKKEKSVAVMVPSDIKVGFRKKDFSPIPMIQRKKEWRELVNLIQQSLPDWKIQLKPHPATRNPDGLQRIFIKVPNTTLVDHQSPAETSMAKADAVIGLPLSTSTTLATAALRWPSLPIISLDTEEELLGDYYKDFPGIDYVTTKDELEKKLKLIASGKYEKSFSPPAPTIPSGPAGGLTEEGFKNIIELIQYVTG